jgi:hypothetical protein
MSRLGSSSAFCPIRIGDDDIFFAILDDIFGRDANLSSSRFQFTQNNIASKQTT